VSLIGRVANHLLNVKKNNRTHFLSEFNWEVDSFLSLTYTLVIHAHAESTRITIYCELLNYAHYMAYFSDVNFIQWKSVSML
jgi:hypothetical protein